MKQREIESVHTFTGSDNFDAYHCAKGFCTENGYSTGSMCAPLPTALKKGDYNVSKWKNLTPGQRYAVDGMITTDGDFRTGNITVTIFKPFKK